jgi:GntR family transcriptional regulator
MDHLESLSSGKKLRRFGASALHEQLSEHLRAFATRAQTDTRLPSEDELARAFDVSRVTVRRAVQTLVEEGLLARRQGRGTFVAGPHVVQSLDRLRPFVDAFSGDDSVQARLLEFRWITDPEVPETFAGDDSSALMFQRLYLTDGVPHALVRVMVPQDIGRRITRPQLEAHPIYHVLQNELQLKLREAYITVDCEAAEAEIAGRLQIEVGSLLLVVDRLTVDLGGRVVEAATHYLLPQVYRLQLTVDGGSLPQLIRLPNTGTDVRGDHDAS